MSKSKCSFILRTQSGAVGMASKRESGSGRTTVQSVARAANLLMLVAKGTTDNTGKSLAAAAGLVGPTAHHLLTTLVEEGLLAKDSSARYSLGPQVAVLAEVFARSNEAPEYLAEPLRRLARTTGETAYFGAWHNNEIRMLAMVEGTQPVRVSVAMGEYTHAYARSTGKVLLAYAAPAVRERFLDRTSLVALTPRTIVDREQLAWHFEQIVRNGYAIEQGEFQLGVACVAAPIFMDDFLLGAYALSVPEHRFLASQSMLVDAVCSVATSVSASLSRRTAADSADPSGAGPILGIATEATGGISS